MKCDDGTGKRSTCDTVCDLSLHYNRTIVCPDGVWHVEKYRQESYAEIPVKRVTGDLTYAVGYTSYVNYSEDWRPRVHRMFP